MATDVTIDDLARAAESKIISLYWTACDGRMGAVDPSELTEITWVEDLLAEQFEIASTCEADAEGWEMARQKC